MQTTTDNPHSRTADAEWCLLGEYPLNELLAGMDIRGRTNTSMLFQTIKAMGIHPEVLSNIEKQLMGFVKEAIAYLTQGKLESPVYIRMYCQKKTMMEINLVISMSQFTAEQTAEPSHIIHLSDPEPKGGWGYFLVKRGGCNTPNSPAGAYHLLDLYLYKEGE